MKRLWTLILLAGVIQPAFADEATPPPKRTHMQWEERFTEANTSHDGHLTVEQAKLGYKTVARHFHDIDADAKGFVTENDIRAWHAMQKAARHSQAADDPLRPRPAFNRFTPDQRPTPGPSQTMLTTPQPAMLTTPQPAMLTTPQSPAMLTTPPAARSTTAPPPGAMVNLDHPAQEH